MRVLRPFTVGDFMQIGGITGTVMNCSARPVRRVERTAPLAGSVDALDAIARLRAALAQVPNVVASPAPEVSLLDINFVGTVIAVRPSCHTDHCWPAHTPTQIIKTIAA